MAQASAQPLSIAAAGDRSGAPMTDANDSGKLVFPVWTYTHSNGSCAIVGGYVVRGRYYFGDNCSGVVWSFKVGKKGRASAVRADTRVPSLVSFGRDSAGNVYAVSLLGEVSELRP